VSKVAMTHKLIPALANHVENFAVIPTEGEASKSKTPTNCKTLKPQSLIYPSLTNPCSQKIDSSDGLLLIL
jgi:hypothetical protein